MSVNPIPTSSIYDATAAGRALLIADAAANQLTILLDRLPTTQPSSGYWWNNNVLTRVTPQWQSVMSSGVNPIKLIIEGNSMSTNLHTGLQTLLNTAYSSGRFTIVNVATAGQATSSMLSSFNTDIVANVVDNETFVTIWTLVNDFYLSSISARDAVNLLWQWCDQANDLGARVILLTPTPRTNVGTPVDYESRRQAALTLIRSEWSSHCAAVADIAADTRFQDSTNMTYFYDGVHLTNTGTAIIQRYIESCIAAMLDGAPDGTPIIDTQPDNAYATPDETVTFTCYGVAEGINGPTYQWQRDSGSGFANISGATSPVYTTETLTLDSHGDLFRCVITNSRGSTTSNSVTLSVTTLPANPWEIVSALGFWQADMGAYVERTSPTTAATNGSAVGTWTSRVGSAAFVSPTDAKRLTYVTNAVNGQPVVRSDGVTDVMTLGAALNAKTIFIVARHPSVTLAQQYPGLITSNNNSDVGLSLEGQVLGSSIFQESQLTSNVTILRNGTQTVYTSVSIPANEFVCFVLKSDTARNYTWQLASGRAAGRFGQWDIAAVGIYEANLTTQEVEIIHDWVTTQFGLTIA